MPDTSEPLADAGLPADAGLLALPDSFAPATDLAGLARAALERESVVPPWHGAIAAADQLSQTVDGLLLVVRGLEDRLPLIHRKELTETREAVRAAQVTLERALRGI